jgi:hypothetical protein
MCDIETTTGYNKTYYQKNKEKWLEHIRCDICDKMVCKASYNKHIQSNIHKKLCEKKNDNVDLQELIRCEAQKIILAMMNNNQ